MPPTTQEVLDLAKTKGLDITYEYPGFFWMTDPKNKDACFTFDKQDPPNEELFELQYHHTDGTNSRSLEYCMSLNAVLRILGEEVKAKEFMDQMEKEHGIKLRYEYPWTFAAQPNDRDPTNIHDTYTLEREGDSDLYTLTFTGEKGSPYNVVSGVSLNVAKKRLIKEITGDPDYSDGQYYCCDQCGCTDVEQECWIKLNDDPVTITDVSGDPSGIYCPQCDNYYARLGFTDTLQPKEDV